jgi:putative two-component system hydrogenase maturation factor HypX/HoxX
MKVLIVSDSFNSLSQRVYVALVRMNYDVSVELAVSNKVIEQAIDLFKPDLVLCPLLTKIISDDLWKKTPFIIIHPGVKGDRGPSSLDRAILTQQEKWGVTLVQAAVEVDSGPIWATLNFPMRRASKSSIYRDELANLAVDAVTKAVKRFEQQLFVPELLDYQQYDVIGFYQPWLRQSERKIDWQRDKTEHIITKIHCSDSNPGVVDTLYGEEYYIYGAHVEGRLVGKYGEILATRNGAVCRATIDGAVWISHMKKLAPKGEHFKLPSATVLADKLVDVPEVLTSYSKSEAITYQEIWHETLGDVGYLYFEFYNGAMDTQQCQRLTTAFNEIASKDVKVIVLMGGRDFWSNGIHLNVIQAADDPAQESWNNINAINDLIKAIINTSDKLVISAMHGSAGAGGVILALAADKVLVKKGIVLNPHYRSMGGLYGSEYWTYLLPKRVGELAADQLITQCLPIGAEQANEINLVDSIIYPDDIEYSSFFRQICRIACQLAHSDNFAEKIALKKRQREVDETKKPLQSYRDQELIEMKLNFFGENRTYHQARQDFVYKKSTAIMSRHLALHR